MLSVTEQQRRARPRPLASSFSGIFSPAVSLSAVIFTAGILGGLGIAGAAALMIGLAVVPGAVYKLSKPVFARAGLPDHRRTHLLAVLYLTGTVLCLVLKPGDPIPATVIALFLGNIGLLLWRRRLDVSGHVSVLTFATLWVSAIFGGAWTWLLILSPLMVISRVALREHTLREALSGASLGLATFCCFAAATTWS